jgi:hypothetical protein
MGLSARVLVFSVPRAYTEGQLSPRSERRAQLMGGGSP